MASRPPRIVSRRQALTLAAGAATVITLPLPAWAVDALAAGPLTLAVSTTAHRDLVSQDVLATRRGQLGGADAPVVMVSAHYDSVIGGTKCQRRRLGDGAVPRDRTGAAGPADGGDRGLQPVGSEEQRLIGSRYYVAQLPQSERNRLTGVFQNDVVATISLERLQVSLELIGTATYATAGPPI